jgi:PadR family transcriptional regulator AphA
MSLRYALLGFLSTTPASGYTLGQKFADGAGAMWEALPSQIYPELRRLETLGWVAGKTAPGDKLNRRIYTVTPLGARELKKWVEAESNEHPPERDAERVRMLFLDRSSPDAIRRHLERHRDHYGKRLEVARRNCASIEDGTSERLRDRLANSEPGERAFVTRMKWFAMDGLVRRAEMEIKWAEDILRWLQSAKAQRPASKAAPKRRAPRRGAT